MVRINSVEMLSLKRPACVMEHVNKGFTLALKSWTDITRRLKQWYHWIHKMTSVLQNLRERFDSYTAPRLRKIHQIPSPRSLCSPCPHVLFASFLWPSFLPYMSPCPSYAPYITSIQYTYNAVWC